MQSRRFFVYNFGMLNHFTEILSILILIMAIDIASKFQLSLISNQKVIKSQSSVRNTPNQTFEL